MLANSATKRASFKFVDNKQCQICGKSFDRKDTLRRHLQIHDKDRPPPKPRKRACIACVRSKVKCLGERPSCSACYKRGLNCVYQQDVLSSPRTIEQDSSAATPYTTHMSPEAHITYPQEDPSPAFTPRLSNNPYTQNATNVFANQYVGLEMPAPFPYSDTQMDWIFYNSSDDVFPYATQMFPSENTILGPNESSMLAMSHPNNLARHTSNLPAHSEPDQDSPLSRLQDPQPEEHGDPEDRWPMEWRAVPVQLSALPPLRNGHANMTYPSHHSLPSINDFTLATIQDYLRIPLEASPWQPVTLDHFPTKEKLDHCIDLYFLHFDQYQFFPIIHRPTFDPAKDIVLTLAIASIGACYSGFDGSRAFSTSLSELTRRLLVFMAEYDPRFVRTESHVTAQLLQSLCGFSSGSKRLFELGDSNRSSIINNARCMKLFDFHRITDKAEHTLEQRWEAWIRAEKSRRLAWAIYDFDASSTFLHNRRPLLSLTEIKMDLPSDSEHWHADSAQAWAALHPWTSSMPSHLPFKSTVDSLFDGTSSALVKVADEFHRFIMVTTLARTYWDLRESAYEPGAPYLPTRAVHSQSIDILMSCMNQFFRPLKSGNKQALYPSLGLIVQQMYLIRTSFVLASDDIADYMHLVWARGPRSKEAQEHLEQWAIQHPKKVRLNVYLAAQALSVVRQCPFNNPREPYYAFHSGFILWSMVSVLRSTQRDPRTWSTIEASSTRRRVCQLDWLGPEDASELQTINDWIECGGEHVLRMYGVPEVDTEQGMQQVLQQTADILKRMPVWGIAQNFLNAILRVLHKEDG